jgi:hypothetical protein
MWLFNHDGAWYSSHHKAYALSELREEFLVQGENIAISGLDQTHIPKHVRPVPYCQTIGSHSYYKYMPEIQILIKLFQFSTLSQELNKIYVIL